MMMNLSPSLFSMKIISDINCVSVTYKIRGIPAAHKPNSNRPYYRRVRIIKPLIYYVQGKGFICHPSLVREVEAKLREEGLA